MRNLKKYTNIKSMGSMIHTFKKCCAPSQKQRVYPRRSFSINVEGNGSELYEVVDVPEWGWNPPPMPDG